MSHEHDGMVAVALRRFAVLPDVRRGKLLEDGVAAACGDERKPANTRRRISGGANEPRVFVVGDGKAADEEFAEVHTMNGPLVSLTVRGAHKEVTGRNSGKIRNSNCHRASDRGIPCVGGHGFGQKASIVQDSWDLFTTLLFSI